MNPAAVNREPDSAGPHPCWVEKDLTDFENLGPDASEFVFQTIDVGMEQAEISDFTPFVTMLAPDGGLVVCRMDVAQGEYSGEEAVEYCRDHLRTVDPSAVRAVAVIWDGYVTLDDVRTEAVFVEAYELGRRSGVLMAQRYERFSGEISRLGNPVLLSDEPEPLVPERRTSRDDVIDRIQGLADVRRRG